MPHRIVKLAVVVALAGASIATVGCRHRHRHDPEKARKFVTWVVDDLLDDLDATDVQRQAIHASKERLLAEGMALRADGKRGHQEIYREWNKNEPDVERVHALIDERVEAFRALAHEAADELIAAHALLTPEQRAEVSERMREHMDDQ